MREAETAPLTFIDLFSGAGGMTLGFCYAGFRPIFAVECDPSAAATYRANFGDHVYEGRIEDLDLSMVPSADVVIGGPPCQGFSPLGKMSPQEQRRREQAELNGLWYYYMRIIEAVQPASFVMENVPELLKSLEYEAIKRKARELGYGLRAGVLNAFDFGVPQVRRRAFVVGVRGGEAELPEPNGIRTTVRDAIGHLPLEPDGRNWHIGRNPTARSLERYKCVPPGGNRFDLIRKRPDLAPSCWLRKKSGSTDVFGRLEWDKPALTIRTEFFKPEKGRYLHPEADRPLTHREAALLQSFPEDFVFIGSKIEVARQIGNAVPPRLAQAVAERVKELLLEPTRVTASSNSFLGSFSSSGNRKELQPSGTTEIRA
ncbi:MAG: DNA cytosine methyltransferase [Bacteroidota bacterium]